VPPEINWVLKNCSPNVAEVSNPALDLVRYFLDLLQSVYNSDITCLSNRNNAEKLSVMCRQLLLGLGANGSGTWRCALNIRFHPLHSVSSQTGRSDSFGADPNVAGPRIPRPQKGEAAPLQCLQKRAYTEARRTNSAGMRPRDPRNCPTPI
jgi:hypothetical protein